MARSDLRTESEATAGPVRLIVLAGRRDHAADALARRFSVPHRCLVPLEGKPLIAHVLQTGTQHPAVASLAVSVEREAFDPVWDVLTALPGRGTVALFEAKDDIAESVLAAAQGWDGPIVVTTADHALLASGSLDAVIASLQHGDVSVALVRREAIEALHPSGRRRYLQFQDGAFAPCDLFGLSRPGLLHVAGVFRGDPSRNHLARRIWRALGLRGLVLIALGLETLSGAVERASRHLRMRVRAVLLADGTQAIGVDDEHSHALVRDLMDAAGPASRRSDALAAAPAERAAVRS